MAEYRLKCFYKNFLEGYTSLPISSLFGKRDLGKGIVEHNGIDIAVPSGTVLKAPVSGVVTENRVQDKRAGKYVTIRHDISPEKGSGFGFKVSLYVLMMHLHSVDERIRVGYVIKEGERIGTTGGDPKDQPNAGSSQGPHLHLEVRFGGHEFANAVDPLYYFLSNNLVIEKETKKVLNNPEKNEKKFFLQKDLRHQNQYTYSPRKDITIPSLTEYEEEPKKKKEKQKTTAKERLAPGIWQITKILIDSSVADKQVLDAGISTQQGSLINYFRKVCQEPLVEFMGDTFGNQYYWIVRKPPFDQESILKMIELTRIIIPENQVISTNLEWNNQGIYSWYRYMPYADLFSQQLTAAIPAVFFPEFASVWGSRPLCVESNYFNWEFSGRHDTKKPENGLNADRIWQNAIRDFKFIIESNAYAPFTRRGTITIVGDRRIKRGTLVMLSGEVFYVDSVTNSYDVSVNSVNRVTTLQVSRGMYYNFIKGNERTSFKGNMSYFNIIDFGKDFSIEKITAKNWKSYVSKWKVNIDNFGFFMSKQQVFLEKIKGHSASVDVGETEHTGTQILLENNKWGTIYSK